MHFMRCGVALKDRNAPVSDLKTDASNSNSSKQRRRLALTYECAGELPEPCGPANLLFFTPSPAPLVACTDGVCS